VHLLWVTLTPTIMPNATLTCNTRMVLRIKRMKQIVKYKKVKIFL